MIEQVFPKEQIIRRAAAFPIEVERPGFFPAFGQKLLSGKFPGGDVQISADKRKNTLPAERDHLPEGVFDPGGLFFFSFHLLLRSRQAAGGGSHRGGTVRADDDDRSSLRRAGVRIGLEGFFKLLCLLPELLSLFVSVLF